MLDEFLSISMSDLSIAGYILCTAASLAYGFLIALIHMFRNRYSKNFIITLVILPAVVQAIIMLVNGNLGTGVAVMGAFGLVRFRSVPGNSREIASIFLAMAVGLATGMGYVGIAGIMVLCIGIAMLLMVGIAFGESGSKNKELKITIPENLEYDGLFDDILKQFTSQYRLLKVRTVNMGSLFELQYQICLQKEQSEKKMMDEIRCRNGNLPVVCGYETVNREEL